MSLKGRISCKPLKRQIIYTNPIAITTVTKPPTLITSRFPEEKFLATTAKPIDFMNQINLNTMCSLFMSRINFIGNDLTSVFAQNIDECCSSCNSVTGCNGWSYNTLSKMCYFKSHMASSEVNMKFISGFPTYSSYICRSGKVLTPDLLTACASYYACTKDTIDKFHHVVLNCPEKLVFNKEKNQCDYPDNVICN